MKQQPDKIFREKLHDYNKPAPSQAWEKIDAGLRAKKVPYLKWSVAASLFLIGLVTYLLWPGSSQPEQIGINNNEPSVQSNDQISANGKSGDSISQISMDRSVESEKTEVQPRENSVAPVFNKKMPLRSTNETEAAHDESEEPSIAEAVYTESPVLPQHSGDEPKLDEPHPALTNEQNVADNEPIEQVDQKTSSENIVLVFTTKDTDEYLLKNKNTEATSSEKKSSTLKKVLRKATDLKTNQDPFGDLRQMKNEILALNFKSDKQRGQKK